LFGYLLVVGNRVLDLGSILAHGLAFLVVLGTVLLLFRHTAAPRG
jgi:hypothetical protein